MTYEQEPEQRLHWDKKAGEWLKRWYRQHYPKTEVKKIEADDTDEGIIIRIYFTDGRELGRNIVLNQGDVEGTKEGIVIHANFADGRKADHKIVLNLEKVGVIRDRAGKPIEMSLDEEIEIVRRFYPAVNSWEEIDLASALEQIRKEREQSMPRP